MTNDDSFQIILVKRMKDAKALLGQDRTDMTTWAAKARVAFNLGCDISDEEVVTALEAIALTSVWIGHPSLQTYKIFYLPNLTVRQAVAKELLSLRNEKSFEVGEWETLVRTNFPDLSNVDDSDMIEFVGRIAEDGHLIFQLDTETNQKDLMIIPTPSEPNLYKHILNIPLYSPPLVINKLTPFQRFVEKLKNEGKLNLEDED